jgi:hypothetical protein
MKWLQGENLPSAYARIYRAIARQESIERCRRTDHDREKAGQPPVELNEADKDLGEIPDTALAEPVMLHAVQTALWDLFGRWMSSKTRAEIGILIRYS